MLALGRPHWLAAGNAAKVAGLALLVPLGFAADGFRGALAGLVAAEVLKYLTSAAAAARRGLKGAGRDLIVTAGIGAVSSGAFLAGRAAAGAAHPDLLGFLCAGTLVVLAWGVAGLVGWRAGRAVWTSTGPPGPSA
jgi:hypothetical protein